MIMCNLSHLPQLYMIPRSALTNTLQALLAAPFSLQKVPQKYSELPWQRESWLAMNRRTSVKDAVHGAWLMASGVLPFSYDGYQWACARAVEAQSQMNKEDLLMMMRLGVEYGVRLSPLSQLIQNQIFLRVHRDYEWEMLDYEDQITQELRQRMDELEANSTDYFSLLKTEDEEDTLEMEEEVEQLKERIAVPLESQYSPPTAEAASEQLLAQLNEALKSRKEREFEVRDLLEAADLLRRWGSSNLKLIQYLQELLTIKLQSEQVEAPVALAYLQFLTFTCQSLFAEYQLNRKHYTARSVKRIYKYQYFYFQEHFRQLITSGPTSSPAFLEQLFQSYAAFPLKQRVLRRKIGFYASSQMQRFGLGQRQDLLKVLLELNGKDERMKKNYRHLLGIAPEPSEAGPEPSEAGTEPSEAAPYLSGAAPQLSGAGTGQTPEREGKAGLTPGK